MLNYIMWSLHANYKPNSSKRNKKRLNSILFFRPLLSNLNSLNKFKQKSNNPSKIKTKPSKILSTASIMPLKLIMMPFEYTRLSWFNVAFQPNN